MTPSLKPGPLEKLKVLIESSTPLVVMETVEEARALRLVRLAAGELNLPVFEWSVADGLLRSGAAEIPPPPPLPGMSAQDVYGVSHSGSPLAIATGGSQFEPSVSPTPIFNTKEPAAVLAHLESLTVEAVFVLKDMHRHLADIVVIRLLREVAQRFSNDRRTIILTAPQIAVPDELRILVEYLDLPLPDRGRMRQIIEEQYKRLSAKRKLQMRLDPSGLDAMASNLGGLTEEEAERAVAESVVARYGLLPEGVTDVLDAKRDALRRSNMLEFIPPQDSLKAVGGLEGLKKWLRKRSGAFDDAARKAGLEAPKGVVILGVQGCGKSLCAKSIAGEWRLPLVKFDSSAVFDKYIGETEKRIQKLFRVAEQLAPCVLWIDEMEKIFAGSSPDSASSDAGTSARLLGAFLSWMQDRKAPVFVAATCNNVTALPPELIRKGRFDEIFFVDLPNSAERKSVFQLQLQRRTLDPAKFDLDALSAASEGFSGAEIDAAIQSSMFSCYAAKQTLATAAILEELKTTRPLSVTRAEEIARLRAWAKDRAVPAA